MILGLTRQRMITFAAASLVGLAGGTPAFAIDAETLKMRSLAATCAQCHGTDGHVIGDEISGLAGQEKSKLLERLTSFRNGTRKATIMHQITRGYSEAQLAALADYFSKQRR